MPPRERQRPPAGSMLRAAPEPLMTSGRPLVPPAPAPDPDPDRPTGARKGREIVDPVFLSGRVPRELRDAFQRQAIAERVKIGELLEKAVAEYVERHAESQ